MISKGYPYLKCYDMLKLKLNCNALQGHRGVQGHSLEVSPQRVPVLNEGLVPSFMLFGGDCITESVILLIHIDEFIDE